MGEHQRTAVEHLGCSGPHRPQLLGAGDQIALLQGDPSQVVGPERVLAGEGHPGAVPEGLDHR